MDNEQENLLRGLLDSVTSTEQLQEVQEKLFKRGVEKLLNSEMDQHLGYSKGDKPPSSNLRNGTSKKTLKTTLGDVGIEVPRDRESNFDPVTIPKHSTMAQEITDTMILLYAKGMSNADITDFIERTYGLSYSTSQVSNITNTLLDDIKEWQSRPLQSQYAVIWMDAIHYKIRFEGKVISKAAMIVLGIDMEGRQDILSIKIVENESASQWQSILNDLRMRGIKDILFMCTDNLTGLTKAVEASFPKVVHQICIVHQIRNSLHHVTYTDRKNVIKDIKEIYQADNESIAQEAYEKLKEKWSGKYAQMVDSWQNNWDYLTAFLDYSPEIRKIIYTTNIIESFNASLRKYTRNKKVFPNDQAALKSIYLAAHEIRPKWQKKRYGWAKVYNQLYICFEERIL